jgi:dienelactone hydrolase
MTLRFILALTLLPVRAAGQQSPAFQPPDDIRFEQASIISEGTRMAAEKFFPKAKAGVKLPTVLMAHGWGGTMRALRPDAVVLARAGFYVVTFDYRGWGESDARILLASRPPGHKKGEPFTALVKEVREVVDPLDFGADWLNAIHWLAGEPMCDVNRIGLWGSSFSGGLVVWAAARDPRVKAVHSQVGSLDGRTMVSADRNRFYDDSTKRARAEIGYPAPLAVEIGQLRGAPIRSRFADYAPVEDVSRAPNCAMQFVIAENEELFDNRDHAIKAHERHSGPKRLVNIPRIKHYGIYFEARKQAQQLAVEWFDQHLKK